MKSEDRRLIKDISKKKERKTEKQKGKKEEKEKGARKRVEQEGKTCLTKMKGHL